MADENNKEEERRDGQKGINIPTWLWVSIVSFLFFVFVLPLLGGSLFSPTETNGPERTVSVERVAENPDPFLGQTVTVNSKVNGAIGNRAFTLEIPRSLGGQLLVVGPKPFEAVGGGPGEVLFNSGDAVEVTGTVRKFNLTRMEQELGVDLQDEEFSQFEDKPVLIANRVQEVE